MELHQIGLADQAEMLWFSFNADALAEVEDATHWYRDNGGKTPSRAFVAEVRRVVVLAAQTLNLGSPGPYGVLRLYLKRFPFTLVYRVHDKTQGDVVRHFDVLVEHRVWKTNRIHCGSCSVDLAFRTHENADLVRVQTLINAFGKPFCDRVELLDR